MPDNKKVALFTNNFFPRLSGVSVAVNFLDAALKKKGMDTLVVAPDYGYGRRVKGVEVFRVKSFYMRTRKISFPFSTFEVGAIQELIQNWQPDIIHSHHPFLLGKAALDMADQFRLPLVYTFHTLYEFFTHYFMMDTDAVRKAVREYVIRYANRCDLVVAPTEPIKEYLVSIGVETRVETVPTGIDFSRFKRVTPEQVEGLRKSYDLERYEGVLLYVGRISKEKNAGLCLEVLSELLKRGHDYALLYIGGGPEIGALQEKTSDMGLSDRVVWAGFLDQETLAAAYFLGDVFLFPSLSDTQGIVLYEAGAAGLPVVAADSMAARAAVKHDQNGLFAKPDPVEFTDAVEEIMKDRERFCDPFDTEAFSHQAIGATYQRLYNELLLKGRHPDPKATRTMGRLIEDIKEMIP